MAASVAKEVLERVQKAAEFTPATTKQKITLGGLVVALAVMILAVWLLLFNRVQSELDTEYRVSWRPEASLFLAPGPSSFYFDSKENQLVARGAIDDAEKRELARLLSKEAASVFPPDPAGKSYWQALDQLAYRSNESGGQLGLLLLVLGGLSGLLGVQLRSVINFIGVTCYQNKLDVVRWWPYYVLRPAIGFVFGLIAILLVRVGLFEPGTPTTDSINWGFVVGILAGFGASEFADRLRLLTKTLFGESPGENPPAPPPAPPPPPAEESSKAPAKAPSGQIPPRRSAEG
jgi:hypothetical protein